MISPWAERFRKAVSAIVDAEGKPLIKLVHNGLRHSFISYRLAILKNVAEVALECGKAFHHLRSIYKRGQPSMLRFQ